MTLEDLGYNKTLEDYQKVHIGNDFGVGRIVSEHKERYRIKTDENEFDGELIGNLRFSARDRYDLPAVGDWVAISEYDDTKALIHHVFPRISIIERQAVGKSGQIQIIATNIDFGLIVQAVDRDFNLNRLERYLTICNASKVEPLFILSKTDLVTTGELKLIEDTILKRIKNVPVFKVSNKNENGYDQLKNMLTKGKTYCLLGSSGVGKSTLLNGISGDQLMDTGEISSSVNKGKHITSHRELFVLKNGGILIDNPGMREVGITDSDSGLEITFETLLDYAQNCRFNNCTHLHEQGCAILEALENGELDRESYSNFQKMEREKLHFESTVEEKKKKDKDFGKMVKNVKKHRKRNKF